MLQSKRHSLICMSTQLDDLCIQTVLEAGFLRHQCSRNFHPHNHLNCELYFVNRGQCTVRCGEQDYVCNQSDILLINSGTQHTVLQRSEDAILYSLRFSFNPTDKQGSSLYSRLFAKLSTPVLLHNQEQPLSLLNQLRQELASRQPLYTTTAPALLQLFYAQLLRVLLDIPSPTLPQPFSIVLPETQPQPLSEDIPQVFYMDRINYYFMQFPLQTASLSHFARYLNLSISQAQRIVKTYYGVPFQERLIQAKLQKSQFLMATTDLSLEEVAEQAGYGSYTAFFKAFTSRTGQTPSQYRETCRKI